MCCVNVPPDFYDAVHSTLDLRTESLNIFCKVLHPQTVANFLSNTAKQATVFAFVKELWGAMRHEVVNPKFLPVSLCQRALPMVTDKLKYSAVCSKAEPNWLVCLFI